MERLRPLIRVAALAAGLSPGLGCVSTAKVTEQVTETFKQAVAPTPPAPASQVVCFWQRRLAQLPDPTRDGAQTSGIVGQMFLISPADRPTEVAGDLAVVVYDETPRPAGAQPMRPEVWHYTRDTLKRLATYDERFGKCTALFLPWPAHWKDVTAVKIAARYQSPGNPDLYAPETRVTLDFTDGGPVWTDVGQPGGANVPNPSRVLQELRAGATVPTPPVGYTTTAGPAQPVGYAAPAVLPPAQPASLPAVPPPAAPTVPRGPVIVPPLAAGS